MNWIYLFIGGFLEILWAVALKSTHGFTRFWPSVYVIIFGGLSILFMCLAVRTLPIGTAYAVWTGIGAAGTVIVGIIALGEPCTFARLACIFLIIAGIVGLRLVSPE